MSPSESREQPHSIPRRALAVAVTVLIAYGSLYPFAFHPAGPLAADIAHFLASMDQPPQGRGDVVANLLLYVPMGLAVTLALAAAMPRILAAGLTILGGSVLSLSIELAQFYDGNRVSAFSDFLLNVVGLVVGAVIALTVAVRLVQASWPGGSAAAFSRLMLLFWLGWRLFPYVPTLEIHHYWRSLQPILLSPNIDPLDLFRYTALWFAVAWLFRTGIGRAAGLFPLAMICFFAAKISIVDQVLVLSEVLGAGLALVLASLVVGRFKAAGLPLAALAMLGVVILGRVLPWQFAATQRPFQWIPFFSFLHGSQAIDTISFAEKFFLYGVTVFLLVGAGLRLRLAAALLCILLLATSYLETFMVGRSAEISDAVLALIAGWIYAYMRRQYHDGPQSLEWKQAAQTGG
jgi:VanZ family protein